MITAAVDGGHDTIQIRAIDGQVVYDLSGDRLPYTNVRNRIAIMTDSIRSYDNRTDALGMISVRLLDRAFVIVVEDRAERGGLPLRISATATRVGSLAGHQAW